MAEEVAQGGTGSEGFSPNSFGIIDTLESNPEPPETLPDEEAASAETPDKGAPVEGRSRDRVPEVAQGLQSRDLTEPGAAQPQASKFRFMDREYDSQESAEQSFRSWEGRLRTASDENSKLVNQLNEYYRYVQAAEQVLKGNGAPANGAAPKSQDATNGAPKKFSEAINWEQVSEIRRIAAATGEDPEILTQRYLAQNVDDYLDKRIGELESRLSEPVQAMQDRQAINTATAQAFLWAQGQRDERGDLIYPELGGNGPESVNEGFARAMQTAFLEFAQKYPEEALSEAGIDYAYSRAQRLHPRTHQSAAAPQATQTQTLSAEARDSKGRFVTASKAAAKAMAPDNHEPEGDDEREEDDGSAEFLARDIARRAPKTVHTRGGTNLGFTR